MATWIAPEDVVDADCFPNGPQPRGRWRDILATNMPLKHDHHERTLHGMRKTEDDQHVPHRDYSREQKAVVPVLTSREYGGRKIGREYIPLKLILHGKRKISLLSLDWSPFPRVTSTRLALKSQCQLSSLHFRKQVT